MVMVISNFNFAKKKKKQEYNATCISDILMNFCL